MSKIKERIISLIKDLLESISSEKIDELIVFLYIKKQLLEALEDFNQEVNHFSRKNETNVKEMELRLLEMILVFKRNI